MNASRLLLIAATGAAIVAFFTLDLGRFLSFTELKVRQAEIAAFRDAHPLVAALAYAAAYITVAGLSLPGAVPLTLIGGAVFGLVWGTLIVSFASTIGATLAFLAARYLFRDAVQQRFGARLRPIDHGIQRDGPFYLFALRLVPVFPFFVINLAMGLTALPTRTFYWVSQLGMLAGTLAYVNAGTQLGQLTSPSGILSPAIVLSFLALGVLPLLARRALDALRARRVHARWRKPRRFDRNLIVIGAGSAGLVTAYIAAAVKAKVTLVEKNRMGGDCLNTGCVPSKALIQTARLLAKMRRAEAFGIRPVMPSIDFAAAMDRVRQVVGEVAPHDSVERYTRLGVEVLQGEAKILSPWEVSIQSANGMQTLSTRAIVIATGAGPLVPPLPGLAEAGFLTSDTIWALRECPGRLLVLGGGPIGCELAQCFARFGSRVTMVEQGNRLLAREDEEAADLVRQRFRAEGIDLLLEHVAERVEIADGEKVLVARQGDTIVRVAFDAILVAVGRAPRTQGFGLEELGIPAARTVETNDFLQTLYPNIYACGDVAGPFQLTHAAAHQAWYAAVNALFGNFKRFPVDYRVLPWATFTEPEVARVGLTAAEADAAGVAYDVTRFDLAELDRAIADGEAVGFVKVLTAPGKDQILGVTIVGDHAADWLSEFVLAMKHGLGLNQILATPHIYPTLAEANKYAAGAWKRAHTPERLLRWVEKYHRWRRG